MIFLAEIKETKQHKTASLDNEYTLKLVTNDSQILDLGKFPADTIFKVAVELEDNKI